MVQLAWLLALPLASPIRAEEPPPPPPETITIDPLDTRIAAEPPQVESNAAEPKPYQVRPGDVIRVFVWKEPELSGSIPVRPDGKVTMPLIGDVDVWNRSPESIGEEIANRLRRFVEEPEVTVAIEQATSSRVFIIGQVQKPGVYALTTQTSVVQAIALAGGFGVFAKKGKIKLIRGIDGSQGVVRIDFNKIADGDLRQNYMLRPGDTLVVP
jgi:polysaccharide export outer membrane protein